MSDSKMMVDKSQPKKMVQGLDAAYFALGHVAGHDRYTHELFAERIEALDSKIEEKKQERLEILKVLVELGAPVSILSDEEYLTGEEAYNWPIPPTCIFFKENGTEQIDYAMEMVKGIQGLQYQLERMRLTEDNLYPHALSTSDDEAEEEGFRSSIRVMQRKLEEVKENSQEVHEKLCEQEIKLKRLHRKFVKLVCARNMLAKKANWINAHVDEVQELASKLVKISLSNGNLDRIGGKYDQDLGPYWDESDSYPELDSDSGSESEYCESE